MTLQVTLVARPNAEAESEEAERSWTGTWLGIQGQTVTPELAQAMNLPDDQHEVLVGQVEAGSPADQAGLRGSYKPAVINGRRVLVGGGIIVALDGHAVNQIEDPQALIRQSEPDQEVTLSVLRGGKQLELSATLAERPGATS